MRKLGLALAFVIACGDSTGDGGSGGQSSTKATSTTSAATGGTKTASTNVGATTSGSGSGNGSSGSGMASMPSDLIDLTDWKLTLPVETDHAGDPDEIVQPELAGFVLDPWYVLSEDATGVRFRANAGGATTNNSGYPRSELREMNGAAPAAWSLTEGKHTMTVRQAITHLPEVKPHVVAGQIHDAEDDVVMIRLEDTHLFVEGGGEDLGTLDASYVLGTPFDIVIEASGGHILISYNGGAPIDVAREGDGMYFKAGCYTQSNPERGDAADAYGEVVIYALTVTHE